jgi:hypothetical protein
MGRIHCAPQTLSPMIAPQVKLLFYIRVFFFGEQNINKVKKERVGQSNNKNFCV